MTTTISIGAEAMMYVFLLGSFFLMSGGGLVWSAFQDLERGYVNTSGGRGSLPGHYTREHNPEAFYELFMLNIGFAVASTIVGVILIWVAVRMAWPKRPGLRGLF